MENTYERSKINLGLLSEPKYTPIEKDGTLAYRKYSEEGVRLVLFYLNDDQSATDLLYEDKVYEIEGRKTPAITDSRFHIADTIELNSMLKFMGCPETLTNNNMKQLIMLFKTRQIPAVVYDELLKAYDEDSIFYNHLIRHRKENINIIFNNIYKMTNAELTKTNKGKRRKRYKDGK